MISNLVTDYIQKRRGEPGLFSFEYNLLPKLISNFYALHGPGIRPSQQAFELFSIYQNNNWTIRWWDDYTIIPSSHHIILKIVVFLESSVICYSAHLSYLKKNNKSKPPPQTNFRALLSNHQCLFNCTMLNVIVWWSTALTTQNSQYEKITAGMEKQK